MADLLAGPYFGYECEWKQAVLAAQCQSGGFYVFLIAMTWLVLQLGGAKHVHAKRVVEFASRWLTSCLALTGPYFGLV
jgi:hypothetical protein